MKRYWLWVVLLPVCCCAMAQQSDFTTPEFPLPDPGQPGYGLPDSLAASAVPFKVRDIVISGNKKTKERVILRELPFHSGDEFLLQDLVARFGEARKQLMNTTLFHEVIVSLKRFEGYNVDIAIDVRERWYLFPMPHFKPVDNFSKWTNEYNMSLSKADYGMKLMYQNPTGRNDKLDLKLVHGYSRQVSISYSLPYFDSKMRWGFGTKVEMGRNHEVSYNTINNKQVHFKDRDDFLRSFFRASAELTYRKAIKTKHSFGIAYTTERVSDTVVLLNPTYFKSARNSISFPEVYYNMRFFDVDYIPYPLDGYASEFTLSRKGWNKTMDIWEATARGFASWPISRKSYLSLRSTAHVKLPFDQPYFNKRFLGFNDISMQGYENFTVDGVAGGYMKASLQYELLKFHISIPSRRIESINHIPFRIYPKIYFNTGYVHDPNAGMNFLANKMLYSAGFGADIVTFYDLILKVEYSVNQLGQKGLYLHTKSYF